MPRAVVVARCDHARGDLEATIEACQHAFGNGVAPLYLPIRDGESLAGLYGLLSQTPADRAPDGAEDARGELIEGIIEQSEDETLMERYLEGEDIEVGTLIDDLETAVARGTFHPVIPVCAMSGIGLDALLEVLVGGFPSPLEHPLPMVGGVDGSTHPPLTADPDGPLAAEVVRTSADAYVGRVSLVRVFSGTLRPESTVHVSGHHATIPAQRDSSENGAGDDGGHDSDERLAHIYSPLGATLREVEECVAGDICALTKLGTAETGDTVSASDHPLLLSCWDLPEPLLPVAVRRAHPRRRGRADQDAGQAGRRGPDAAPGTQRRRPTRPCSGAWARRTPTWCCPGCAPAAPRSTPSRCGCRCGRRSPKPARVTGRHVKQSGGHGQYAVCHVEFEPLPRGAGFEFESKVVGGSVPTQYIPSVEKGIRTQLLRGLTDAKHPAVDLQGHPGRRQGAQRRLLRRRVPDRGRAGPAGGGRGVRHGAAGAAGRGGHPDPGRAPRRRAGRPVRAARPGARHRGRRAGPHRSCAPRCRAPSCCATRWTCGP